MSQPTGNSGGKPAAAKKRQAFKDTRNGVIPTSIDSFSELILDASTKAALNAASAKLVVEMDAGGTRVLLTDLRTGQMIGGPEDLQRLGSIRTFVNRERKSAANVEVAKEISTIAFRSIAEMPPPKPKPGALDASYTASVRPLMTALHNLEENRAKLNANTCDEERELFEKLLKGYFNGSANSITSVMMALAKGESIKGKLNEELLMAGVPQWVYTRITNKNLILERSQPLRKVLFPADPSKGLHLSVREWRDDAFCEMQSAVLGMSYLVFALLQNEEFLRAITKIAPDISLYDETNPSVAKLLKVGVAVIPPFPTAHHVRETGGKQKSGWKFPTPGMSTEVGAIQSLSVTLLRVYAANLQSVDLIGDYYNVIAPASVSRADVTPTNNFYVQWGNATNPDRVWHEILTTGGKNVATRLAVWRWIRAEMRLSENADGGKSLRNALFLTKDNGEDAIVKHTSDVDSGEEPDPNDPQKVIKKVKTKTFLTLAAVPTKGSYIGLSTYNRAEKFLRQPDAVEGALIDKFAKEMFVSKKPSKTKKANNSVRLTRLSREATELLEEVKEHSPYLATQMADWLRGFSDLRTQNAAVKLANASFDELFTGDVDEEESSVRDWAEESEDDD